MKVIDLKNQLNNLPDSCDSIDVYFRQSKRDDWCYCTDNIELANMSGGYVGSKEQPKSTPVLIINGDS
jgi:hypothetical protein